MNNKRDHLLARGGMQQEGQIRIVVDKFGTKRYHNNNYQLHREDGPAVIYADGVKYWWVNGQYHRTDGPAIDRADGTKSWWVNGERLTEYEFLKHPLCTIK